MNITATLTITDDNMAFQHTSPFKTTALYGVIEKDEGVRFEDGTPVLTSNVETIKVVDDVVYAVTLSGSVYKTNIPVDKVVEMIENCEHDIDLDMPEMQYRAIKGM